MIDQAPGLPSMAALQAFERAATLGSLVDAALAKKAKYKDVDALIHAIYQQNAK